MYLSNVVLLYMCMFLIVASANLCFLTRCVAVARLPVGSVTM